VSVKPSQGTLGVTAAKGAATTMLGQLGKIVVQFGGIILLARLLSPEDYGLLAMVLAVIGVGEILRDFGLSTAAIQAPEVTTAQRNNLFWMNTGLGVLCGAAAFLCAEPLGSFYGDPRVVLITQILAVTFLLNGITAQFRAQLNRELRFGAIAVTDMASQALGLIFGLIGALLGWGYWALVVQQVTICISSTLFMLSYGRWLPGLPSRRADMKPFLSFGWSLMATQVIGYVSRNVDSLIIGAKFGAGPVGLYNRAFQLLMLPLSQISAPATTVALPVLARLRNDPERYSAFLLRGQTILLHATVAIFAFASAQADPLIVLVLGSQWIETVPLFQILCVAGCFQAAGYAVYWVFLSKGLTGSNLRYSLLSRTGLIGLILLGSLWGPTGVAISYSVGVAIMWPFSLWWIGRISDAPAKHMFTNGLRAVIVYGVSGAASFAVSMLVPVDLSIARIGIGLIGMLIPLTVVFFVWPRYRVDVIGIFETGRMAIKKKALQG
jgi:PST family polysaccharide transporter